MCGTHGTRCSVFARSRSQIWDFSEQNLIQTLNEVFANKMSGGKAANRFLNSRWQFNFNTLLSTWLSSVLSMAFSFSIWLFTTKLHGYACRGSVVVYH